MNITILGSGTCVPSLDRYPCSAMIQINGTHILLDIGPGIMGQLMKTGVSIDDIDIIFLSHFHLDHCADLAPFLFATKYPLFERTKKLTLVGGTGIKDFYSKLNDVYNNTLEMPEDVFTIIELPEKGETALGVDAVRFSWEKPVHKPESRACRISDTAGYALVYSGDTDYSPSLIALAENADILICEAALPDGQKTPGHATPSIAGDMARQAGVKKLVLTHFYPECDQADITAECEKTFQGDIILARDLMTIPG